jgi:hypothetical protein
MAHTLVGHPPIEQTEQDNLEPPVLDQPRWEG